MSDSLNLTNSGAQIIVPASELIRLGVPPSGRVRSPCLRGDRRQPCALCDGNGDVVNPGNANPRRAVTDWLPPVICPRCGGTGKDPKP